MNAYICRTCYGNTYLLANTSALWHLINFFVWLIQCSILKVIVVVLLLITRCPFVRCQGLNVALFNENKNLREYISMVPTSAHSGDGMGNLIALLCEIAQTMLAKRITYSEELQATVMEVCYIFLVIFRACFHIGLYIKLERRYRPEDDPRADVDQ